MVTPWILISIVLTLILIGLLALLSWKYRKTRKEPDYYALFIAGMCWVPLGIPLKNYGLVIGGLILMIVGLTHKDKWKKNRITWEKLSSKERKLKTILIVSLGVLVLFGLAAYILMGTGMIE
ncbi:hypothetical protein JW711_05860 [Candidatus Woesearchaeota archaeon]|nr:hypothetical protein [Candidatus Woesearchaeota archaeon]